MSLLRASLSAPSSLAVKNIYLAVSLCLFVLGWVGYAFSLFDISRYSVTLLHLSAILLCFRLSSRSVCYLALPIASTLLALLVAFCQNPDSRTYSNAVQQLLAVTLAASIAAIPWRQHLPKLEWTIALAGIPVSLFGAYQMVARMQHLAWAYLPVTNQQEYAAGGLQRGWDNPEFTRASSLFVEPSEFGYFSLWLFVIALTGKSASCRLIALCCCAISVLSSQSLSAALGVGVLLTINLLTSPLEA